MYYVVGLICDLADPISGSCFITVYAAAVDDLSTDH